ncbi:uncharacterized protein LOC132129029 [Carassius carassius]|uniref:uncharacterized protein LOC132129029 n=1 Tax=Carassius carassius TaxID=217509 RepID=UPI002868F401|nr:uncharacterized protein LOC132129029 [Carassius carassius]
MRPQKRNQQVHAGSGILRHQELKTKSASSKRGSENVDPNASPETGKGVNKLKGVSRLPVLAKSLQPALSELSQNPSHNKWEQRALTSKAQKKRISTKPFPFNLSQSRTHNQRNKAIPLGKAALVTSTRLKPGAKLQRVVKKSHGVDVIAGSAFSPDPSVLRGILQISGTTPHAPTGLTGRATSVYSAQRVPVRKLQTDDSPAVKVPAGSGVSFSPDPVALRSILLNEGVRAGGATPRVSTCPTRRGTSIYSAQRVPVKKNKPEVVVAATSSGSANRTPVMKWTPQRIANPKPQSVTEVQSTIKENLNSNHCHTKNEGKKTAQPFIQAAHRGSVIVFSSSQRLGKDWSQDTLKTHGTGDPLQLFEGQLTSHNALPLQSDQSNGSQINPSLDLPKQSQSKAPTVMQSTAVSALRRRHTPLEEMFLDEECATYTSRLLSCPLQPRYGNPVAATLLFQDSKCFLPIGLSSPVLLSLVPSDFSIRA